MGAFHKGATKQGFLLPGVGQARGDLSTRRPGPAISTVLIYWPEPEEGEPASRAGCKMPEDPLCQRGGAAPRPESEAHSQLSAALPRLLLSHVLGHLPCCLPWRNQDGETVTLPCGARAPGAGSSDGHQRKRGHTDQQQRRWAAPGVTGRNSGCRRPVPDSRGPAGWPLSLARRTRGQVGVSRTAGLATQGF